MRIGISKNLADVAAYVVMPAWTVKGHYSLEEDNCRVQGLRPLGHNIQQQHWWVTFAGPVSSERECSAAYGDLSVSAVAS